ncbi:MAG TPA: hypothetical protein VIS99_08210 [Terrimicrobiaceae bacterium]
MKDAAVHLGWGGFMQIHFYLPERYLPDLSRRETWKAGTITQLEESGKIACAQCWIFQTWLALEQNGFPAQLTHSIPSKGIMVALTNCLAREFNPPKEIFFVGIVADFVPHARANLHVVQNGTHAKRLWNSAFLPLWPHPNLIPRDAARGSRFENVCFFGEKSNLTRELADPRWSRQLKEELGLNFIVQGADRWHDYSQADCVLAVRDFRRSPHLHKPATKLYNAWLADVPFIGGMDSAYAHDGKPGNDFLQAATVGELLAHLRQLQQQPALRQRLVAAGRIAGQDFAFEATLARWRCLLGDAVPELAREWQRKSMSARGLFRALQKAAVWLDIRFRR